MEEDPHGESDTSPRMEMCSWTGELLLPMSGLCFGAPCDPGFQGPGSGPVKRCFQAFIRKSWQILSV